MLKMVEMDKSFKNVKMVQIVEVKNCQVLKLQQVVGWQAGGWVG
jgi:hypothetical protein